MLRLRTFGGLSLDLPDPAHPCEVSPRRLALLATVGSRRDGVARESLLAMFWPESTDERARNALNQALFVLRRDLPDGAMVSDAINVRLDPAVIACDAAQFLEAIEAERYEDAVSLYSGPFLDGVHIRNAAEFDEWRDGEAARFAHTNMDALEKLAIRAEGDGDAPAAAGWWERLAAADPANSRVALKLMLARVSAQDPAAALRHARVHELLLREEFGVACDPTILELADGIRSGRLPASPRPSIAPARAAEPREVARAEPATRRVSNRVWGGRARHARATTAIGVVTLAVAVVIAILGARGGGPSEAEPTSLAMLPLRALDTADDPVPGYVRDGLTEGLINALAQLDGVRVIARTSVFRIDEEDADPIEVASRLGVDAVVVGWIQPVGDDDFRVGTRLVRAGSGVIVWSGTFQRGRAELLALEAEVAAAIAKQIGATPVALATRPPGSTANPTAHAFFLQGVHLWNLRRPDDLRRAIEYFERAAAEDTAYGLPHALIAQSRLLMASPGERSLAEAARAAAEAARHALAIDDRISAAHTALAAVHQARGEWHEAEQAFLRALELNPSDALAHSWYGFMLMYSGREQEGMHQLELAHRLDPLSLGVGANLGWGYYFSRRYDDAAHAFGRVLALDSALFAMYNGMGRALQQLGRRDEALDAYRRAVELGGTPQGRAFLAQALARFGSVDEARAIRDELAAHPAIDPLMLAIIDVGLGDVDRAFAGLDSALVLRSSGLAQVTVDPVYDPLRHDPRFSRFMTSIRAVRTQ